MPNPTDVSSAGGDSTGRDLTAAQAASPGRQASGLNQALAWVGVMAGGVLIVAVIFFSGFFLSWFSGDHWEGHSGPEPMACCPGMKPGDKMPMGGQMMPGGTMGPATQAPTNAPRP
jgi:hypothetical protein